MLLLASQVQAIAKKFLVCRLASWRTVLVWLIIFPFILSLVPYLAGQVLVLMASRTTSATFPSVPRCSDALGTQRCCLLIYTVKDPTITNYAHKIMENFNPPSEISFEGFGNKSKLLSAVHFPKTTADIVFLEDPGDYELICKYHMRNVVAAVEFFVRTWNSSKKIVDYKVSFSGFARKTLDKRFITGRLDAGLSKYYSEMQTGTSFRLPFRLFFSELAWFSDDFVSLVQIVWLLFCITILIHILVFFVFTGIFSSRERQAVRYLKSCGLRNSSYILGILTSLLFISIIPFSSFMAGQNLVGSYWTQLGRFHLLWPIWSLFLVALFSVCYLFSSLFKAFGYISIVSLDSFLGIPLSLVSLFFTIFFQDDIYFVFKVVSLAGPQITRSLAQKYHTFGWIALRTLKLFVFPLRLPVILFASMAMRAISINSLYQSRISFRKVNWEGLLSPDLSFSSVIAAIHYCINLYIPLLKIRYYEIEPLKNYLLDSIDRVVQMNNAVTLNMLREFYYWFLSVTLIFFGSWYFTEITEGPNRGAFLFFFRREYWTPSPSLHHNEENNVLTVSNPSQKISIDTGHSLFIENFDASLLNILKSLNFPPGTTIMFNDHQVHPSRLFGFIASPPDIPQIVDELRVFQFISLLCGIRNVNFKAFWERNHLHFKYLDLMVSFDSLCGDLSEDMKKRLSFFCSLIGTDEIILMYDPFSQISHDAKNSLKLVLHSLCKERHLLVAFSNQMEPEFEELAFVASPTWEEYNYCL